MINIINIINNIIKKFNKNTLLEKIVIFFIFLMLFLLIFKKNKEGFDGKPQLIKKYDIDIFDDFYVNIYDDLVICKDKNNFEINKISSIKPINNNSKILDIGSGTGHHVNLIAKKCKNVIGIDKSKYMIKKSKNNYPKLEFKNLDALNAINFQQNTFTHITCFYFTIYYVKDKNRLLQNCYHWLKPNGVLILHIVNVIKFDSILPSNVNNNIEKDNSSKVLFVDFEYKSNFLIDKENKQPNALFKEKIKFNNKNIVRINEHRMYMDNEKDIKNIALSCGFILDSIIKMDQINYQYNYLYIFKKPN